MNIKSVEMKKMNVVFPYKHVMAFLIKAETTDIFSTVLKCFLLCFYLSLS